MQQFIRLNLKKFKYIFLIPAGVMTAFIWFLFLFVDSSKTYTLSEKIFIPPTMGLYVGFIILTLAFVSGYYTFYKNRKTLNKYPYIELEAQLGFKKQFFGKNNIWRFTEEILVGHQEGFPIEIHSINENGKKKIGVTVLTEINELDDLTYKKTFEYFEKEDIYFGVGGSSKTFELEKGNTGNLEQIKTELTTFIRALEAADLKPRELKNGWA